MNNQKTAPLLNEELTVKQDMQSMPDFIRYDEGLKEFIQTFFPGDIIIAPDNEFWEFYVKNNQNDVKFPAVSLYPGIYTLDENQNNFATMQFGPIIQDAVELKDEATNEKKGSTALLSKAARTLFFNIPYTITIWALTRDDALHMVQEMAFLLYQHGEFPIKYQGEEYFIPYKIDPSINANSTVGMNAPQGTMYTYSFDLSITAPIFDSKNYYNVINRNLQVFTNLGEEKI